MLLHDERIRGRIAQFWQLDARTLALPLRLLLRGARVALSVIRDLADGNLSLRAMSLVYTTLLSLVPLLAVSFAVSQAFGMHNRLDGWLIDALEPLGDQAASISGQIVGFVENVNVKVLGTFGLAVLIYTVISLTQKVESAVNHTWRIRQTRSFFERFSHYLSVILIGPLLIGAAVGVYGSVMATELVQDVMSVGPVGELRAFAARLVPYVLVMAAFTFVYVYIPNTRVKIGAALRGGVVAGLLWTMAGGAFATFVVSSTAYAAIYSSFAILVLFLIWLYVGWLVLLIGASVAFYCQHPEHQGLHRTRLALGGKALERLGLELACRVAQRFLQGESPLPLSMLAHELNAPTDSLRQVARRLEQAGLLRQIDDHDVLHLPARDLATITLSDIVIALRETGQDRGLLSAPARHGLAVERCAAKVDAAVAVALGDRTLRDLALESLDGVMVAEPEPGTSQAPVVIETDMNSPEGIAKP